MVLGVSWLGVMILGVFVLGVECCIVVEFSFFFVILMMLGVSGLELVKNCYEFVSG